MTDGGILPLDIRGSSGVPFHLARVRVIASPVPRAWVMENEEKLVLNG